MGSPPGSAPLHAAARAFNRGQATDEDEVRPVFESISVPITVPIATLLRPPVSEKFDFVGKAWSEWQDLNLRPPRPEREAPLESSMLSVECDHIRGHSFAFGCGISVGFLSGTAQGVNRIGL